MVNIFGFEIRKVGRHKISDDERQLALDYRQEKAKLRQEALEQEYLLKKMERQAMINNLTEMSKSKTSIEETLITLFAPLLVSKFMDKTQTPQETTGGLNVQNATINEATDEQIKTLIEQVPKNYLERISKEKDETIKQFIKEKNPAVTDKTLNRAIKIFREIYPIK